MADYSVQYTEFGSHISTVLNFPEDCEDFVPCYLLDAAAESLAIRDIWIGGDLVGPTGVCHLAGAWREIWTKCSRGSSVSFAAVDRDDVSGYFSYYGLDRSKLPGLTNISGTFQANETIVGGTSGARTTVLAVGGDYLEVRYFVEDSDGEEAEFTDGETITGQTSGATATLDTPAFEEGDVLYLRKPFLQEEWLYKESSWPNIPLMIQPGGSSPVTGGFYFRIMLYNADVSDTLTVKAALILGTK